MARLHDIHAPLPGSKKELTERAADHTPTDRAGDYAQAVMDLGATICTPRNPACGICPLRDLCAARANGTAGELPKKSPKKPKPVRHGVAYVARRQDGAWLLETRPPQGLLGGMMGWPVTDWIEDGVPKHDPPVDANWRDTGLEARHTFTHFHLRLAIRTAILPIGATPLRGGFVGRHEFRPSDLPTLMRKVFDLTHATLRDLESDPGAP
jgi:A/G-specific adenine glycosylase